MKKFIICLLTILLCTTLTGCKLTDDIQSFMKDKEVEKGYEDVLDKLREDSADVPLTADTLAKGAEWSDAQTNLVNVQENTGFWQGLGDGIVKAFSFGTVDLKEYRVAAAEAEVRDAETAYNNAYNSDELRLAYEADRRESRDKQDKKVGNKNIILIAIAVLVILLVLFLLLRKPKKAVATAPAPAQRAPVPVTEHKQLGAVKADKMVACRKLASKYNLDADKELVKYNGDVDKLYSSLIMMTPLDE